MLDTLRKNSRSALIYVFFAIIIVVFVFSFGPGSSGCKSASLTGPGLLAAKVNGRSITVSEFEQAYARTYQEYQQRAGGEFSEELARTLRLRETTLERLIDSVLLAQAAAEQGIVVTAQELAEEIQKIPGFQRDGAFDHQQYELIIRHQLGTTPAAFEEELRRSLLSQKLIAGLVSSAKVSDDEVRAAFVKEKERIDLGYVRFSPAAYKAQVAKPTDEQIDALLKEKPDRVETYFQDYSFRYNKPKRVSARHILARVEEGASEADVEAARKRAAEARKRVEGGEDFAKVAQEVSDDPGSKERGGDLGTFGPGTMDPAFQDAAFALEAGQLSEVVRSRFGFHVIKVEAVFPEEKKELKDVEREIAAELLTEDAAKEMARTRAEAALAELKAGKKLESLFPASEEGAPRPALERAEARPEYQATGPFAPGGQYIPGIGTDEALSTAALSLTEQGPNPDKVFEINDSFYVVSLKARERADLSELESKMAEYREIARIQKANDLVQSFVDGLKAKASIDRNEALLEAPWRGTRYSAGG